MWSVLQGELAIGKLHSNRSSRAAPHSAGSEFLGIVKGVGGSRPEVLCRAAALRGSLIDLEPECPPYWQALVALRRVLLAQFSAFPLNGADLYEELKTSTAILSTGIGRFVCEPGQGESRASC